MGQRLNDLRDEFRRQANAAYPDIDAIRRDVNQAALPVAPVMVADARHPSRDELDTMADDYLGDRGLAYFFARDWAEGHDHPLLDLAAALNDIIPTRWPVDHPMENHPEARDRFGEPDGTLKIYDLPVPIGGSKYREQAETNESFDAHNDGLGFAGLIRTAALFTDEPPLLGGYTYFTNVVRYSEILAVDDPEAYSTLFAPNAITARRPRGKGAIEVKAPVLYLGPGGDPRCFLRVASGEYEIEWNDGSEAALRAKSWCQKLVSPFAKGSVFVHLMRPGEGVFIRNQSVIHGRTPFIDGDGFARRLARKWYVSSPDEQAYRHAPGLSVHKMWKATFPESFSDELATGDWSYSAEQGKNVRSS